ncbi:MAG: xanthine dehydrogenase family protein molybdopterin-binding subunit, partial [Anaerolineae bacterium]|nr:xanthine dehydrogenase family protein molybdopterin-binding subunit [Anaerolineae bacterium]
MAEKYFGKPIKRLEDPQIITGRAKFIDDIDFPGMLHAAFLRSDYSHAIIKSIDTSAAKKRPGVVAVYTAEDFGDYWHVGPLQVPPPTAIEGSRFNARPLPPIAKGKVRFSGEPLAVILAESRYIAEDAIEDVIVELEPLPAVVDLEQAWEEQQTLVHDDLPTNWAALVIQQRGDYEKAKAEADVVISEKLYANRNAGAAMENRGIVASWDDRNQEMTVWATSQAPIPLRNTIAGNLGLAENQVHVIMPNIGGAFGPKVMTSQADDVLLPWLARKLNRPIKWFEDRRENFLATTSERDQVHFAEIALKKDGTILGVKDVFYHNTGAYNPYGMTVPLNTQTHTVSNYRVPAFYTEIRMVFTNTMVVTPVRGAGRPQGVFVMERLMDAAARKLGMDVAELRIKNLLMPDEFQLRTGIIGQDFVEGVLDSGNYKGNLEKCMEMVEYEKFRKEEQPKLRAQGKHVGMGIVTFTEGTAVGPYEGAKITVGSSGKVNVATGISTQGQGHYTVFAQIVADQLGVKIEDVRVVTGDTDKFAWGAGTFASRGATVAGTAIYNAAIKVREKIFKTASKWLGVPEDQVELSDGEVRVKGKPDTAIKLGDLAMKANPTRGTIEPGVEPGLEATAYYGPPYGATGAGACAMTVEVDTETMQVKIKRLVLVHDCGTVINPLLLEGQVQGAVSMGIGNAYYEKLVYDENGQLVTASFMDYLMPQATDMPEKFEIGHLTTTSPLNPLGMKGVGEAGAIPVPPAFVQAVEDALNVPDLFIADSNLSPSLIYDYVQQK